MAQITIEQAMQIALGYHQAGRFANAEDIYCQVLRQDSGHAGALHLLGVLNAQTGRLDAAIDLITRAIAFNPAVADYHIDLGESYRLRGELDASIASFHRALALKPEVAKTHNNLGNALMAQGRASDATAAYRRAVELRPDDAEFQENLGIALHKMGHLDEAIAAYSRARDIKPDHSRIHSNLGIALQEAGRDNEAIAAFRRAVELKPDDARGLNNLGIAYHTVGAADHAIAALTRAIELKPDLAEAYNNLGNVLKDQGRLDDALAALRRAVAAKRDCAETASSILFLLHYHPDLDAQQILAEHRRWARRFADPLAAEIRPHANDRAPDRCLRIGFLSPDLRDHPVGQSLLSLFRHRDRRQVAFIGYSDVRLADGVADALKSLADEWHETMSLGDPEVADRIRADRIDILVDTTLHTAYNRMLVFARKPAPVQVTMLGPPATTGLATMDYRLTDPYLDPPGTSDADYSEESVRLPHGFWIFQPPEPSPPVTALPALCNGFVTFGYLNQLAKVSRPTLQLWRTILQALPGSRLVLQSPCGSHRDQIHVFFDEGGIAAERIDFVVRTSRGSYLERFQELDLCLDPFPYNGHTSTFDALWMGVPVITLAGRTAVSRGGASILSNAGLTEFIARTAEQYVEIVIARATNLARLAALRAELRSRMLASPLLDGRQYATDVEAAFRWMWKAWCRR
jgi:predicted O-linked N-acetylglucosamine transferase (SPINDLY family)